MTAETLQAPYDAVLLVSFGGPEQAADVLPFLENVTRGRGIPPERLADVARHYDAFGGRSPINDQCRSFLAAVRADFDDHGVDLPLYWGNRNWDPYLTDTVARMQSDGVRRAAAFVTSAYSSYSGCRQYRENLFDAVDPLVGPPRIDKLRHYFNHPGFVRAFVDTTVAELESLPDEDRADARLVFVTHSIPSTMAETAGPSGGAYVDQHRSAAALVAAGVRTATGLAAQWDLVHCSRSGSPRTPWLEPDVNDHLTALKERGTRAVVVVPVGFVSDHMEVVYDLDTEAAETARGLGLTMRRAATAGTHPDFVAVVRDLLRERAAVERGDDVPRAAAGDRGPSWDVCAATCCPNLRAPRPALCELPMPPSAA
ncbi:MAG: ferrochelatase [Nocardioidaceae bacterium]